MPIEQSKEKHIFQIGHRFCTCCGKSMEELSSHIPASPNMICLVLGCGQDTDGKDFCPTHDLSTSPKSAEWESGTPAQRKYWNSLKGLKNEKAPNWKKIIGKSQCHKWLSTHYGKPKICEGVDCRQSATWYDWALKKGKKYERNRNNFLRLCRSCHRRYDLTFQKKKQAIKNLWWNTNKKNPGKLFSKTYGYNR